MCMGKEDINFEDRSRRRTLALTGSIQAHSIIAKSQISHDAGLTEDHLT